MNESDTSKGLQAEIVELSDYRAVPTEGITRILTQEIRLRGRGCVETTRPRLVQSGGTVDHTNAEPGLFDSLGE